MRLLYIIAAVAMLAMLIPAMAVPVSAADYSDLKLFLVNPLAVPPEANGAAVTPDGTVDPSNGETYAYNAATAEVEARYVGAGTVASWAVLPVYPATSPSGVVTAGGAPGNTFMRVQGTSGEIQIKVTLTDGTVLYADKKWGDAIVTDFDENNQSVPVSWNESVKKWEGSATVTDNVSGTFLTGSGIKTHAVQGVIFNWYLIASWETVPMASGEAQTLKDIMATLDPAYFTQFVPSAAKPAPGDAMGTNIATLSGVDGSSTVYLWATGEEAVKVVVVPEYTTDPQMEVTPEVATVNFWTREMEVVPQVRWAGEKIVLEKNFFGHAARNGEFEDFFVRFTATGNSKASLEGFGRFPAGGVNDGQTVDVLIDDNGFASVILYCPVQGCIDVSATLFRIAGDGDPVRIDANQHHFSVYYLKLSSITLGNVIGKRTGHNEGLWTPENPWDPDGTYVDPATPDNTTVESLNVSQDALLRARVKGWFSDADGGVWTLPDDWAELADEQWKMFNIHWDIMNDPSQYINGNPTTNETPANISTLVASDNPLGDYLKPYRMEKPPHSGTYVPGVTVAANPVIGPFTPGLEQPTATGSPTAYAVPNARLDPNRQYEGVGIQTVVPDGALNWWDAPMPPAKITFMITDPDVESTVDNAGFFKEAYKEDIYYGWWYDPSLTDPDKVQIFTNPFYCIMVPAHWAIPAFLNNGGYDWDTFGVSSVDSEGQPIPYGPYGFWWFLNRQTENPLVPSSNPTDYPTLVQVYSDNHGEAMVYLNGDWNLDLETVTPGYPYDIKTGTTVGTSTLQAMASYPYVRQPSASYKSILSNQIEKDWLWGKQILGPDPWTKYGFGGEDDLINGSSIRMVLQVGQLDTRANIPNPDFGQPGEPATIPNPDYLRSDSKMAFVWVTDRDGFPPSGEKITWDMEDAGIEISETGIGASLSNYNSIMLKIKVDNGFLRGTAGVKDPNDGTKGTSYLMALNPNPMLPDDATQDNALAAIFYKFYNPTRDPAGLQPKDFAVAGVQYTSSHRTDADLLIHLYEIEGVILRDVNMNWAVIDDPDDPLVVGDANYDGVINMGDVILAERMMLGLNESMQSADFNGDGKINIADIIGMERAMLGL